MILGNHAIIEKWYSAWRARSQWWITENVFFLSILYANFKKSVVHCLSRKNSKFYFISWNIIVYFVPCFGVRINMPVGSCFSSGEQSARVTSSVSSIRRPSLKFFQSGTVLGISILVPASWTLNANANMFPFVRYDGSTDNSSRLGYLNQKCNNRKLLVQG